jgi:hypothetical protein
MRDRSLTVGPWGARSQQRSRRPGAPEAPPNKIIYTSRTHSQLSQTIKELRQTAYGAKAVLLGSRDQYCINDKVPVGRAHGKGPRPQPAAHWLGSPAQVRTFAENMSKARACKIAVDTKYGWPRAADRVPSSPGPLSCRNVAALPFSQCEYYQNIKPTSAGLRVDWNVNPELASMDIEVGHSGWRQVAMRRLAVAVAL